MSERQKGIPKNKEQIEKAVATRRKNGSYQQSPQSKLKTSLALKGVPKSKEHNAKVSAANKGRIMSAEFCHQLSERQKGKIKRHLLKPVIQYSKEDEFMKSYDCIRDAMRATGILETSISNCLSKKSKSAGGFKWSYQNK